MFLPSVKPVTKVGNYLQITDLNQIPFSLQSPTQASIIKYIFRINESNILLYLLSSYDIQFKCMSKISIRFFNDREVRAIWDETDSKWWFSVLDIVGVLNAQDDDTKNRNYWK